MRTTSVSCSFNQATTTAATRFSFHSYSLSPDDLWGHEEQDFGATLILL
jgi:hypothetical protein